ncbi:MAG: hypothetical protein JWO97_3290 [Acidobacteria bacterium]|nr:hypothetical protein [Acidobacteriota bacterium]
MEFDALLAIAEAFRREDVRYEVCGGVAVNLHGAPRATEDADFLVDPSPENLAAIKRALQSIWDDPNLDELHDDDMCTDYPFLTYRPPNVSFSITLMARAAATRNDTTTLDVRGVPVSIVTPRALYDMKRRTLRHQDGIDAIHLRERFDFPE